MSEQKKVDAELPPAAEVANMKIRDDLTSAPIPSQQQQQQQQPPSIDDQHKVNIKQGGKTQTHHYQEAFGLAPPAAGGRKIVFAVDASEHSHNALLWALQKLVKKEDSLTLLTVYEYQPLAMVDLYGSMTVAELNAQLEKKGETSAVDLLKQYGRECVQLGFKPHLTVLKGLTKQSIVDFVEQQHPDMLLISSRGLGGVKRFWLGSVSDFCVHNCHCPVLVIKDQHIDELHKQQQLPTTAAATTATATQQQQQQQQPLLAKEKEINKAEFDKEAQIRNIAAASALDHSKDK